MADPHTVATYAFARMRRDGELDKFANLKNTVVCVETDLVHVVQERATHFFPDGGSIAIYYPAQRRFRFIWQSGNRDEETDARVLVANDKQGQMTIGFLVDMIYKDPAWTDQLIGEVSMSTAAIEKKLALT